MNDFIRSKGEVYKKYEDDEKTFLKNNPDVELKERNQIIDEWSADSGGYHTNTGLMKYMKRESKSEIHPGWEKGVQELDAQITGRLNEPIIVFRTTEIADNEMKIGGIIDKDGFIATSLSREQSIKSGKHKTTVEVQVPAKFRCLYLGEKTGNPGGNEKELLFPDEYEIKLTSIKTGDFKGKMIKK